MWLSGLFNPQSFLTAVMQVRRLAMSMLLGPPVLALETPEACTLTGPAPRLQTTARRNDWALDKTVIITEVWRRQQGSITLCMLRPAVCDPCTSNLPNITLLPATPCRSPSARRSRSTAPRETAPTCMA